MTDWYKNLDDDAIGVLKANTSAFGLCAEWIKDAFRAMPEGDRETYWGEALSWGRSEFGPEGNTHKAYRLRQDWTRPQPEPKPEPKLQGRIVWADVFRSGMFDRAVHLALHEKVGGDGKKSNYSSENHHDWLEIMCRDTLRAAATNAMCKWIEANQAKIEASILKDMRNKQATFAKVFVDGLTRCLSSRLLCPV